MLQPEEQPNRQHVGGHQTFAIVPKAVLTDRRFQRRPRALLVIFAYCLFANRETRLSYPSISTVAELTGIAHRHVTSTVSMLKEWGWLIPTGSKTDQGVNIYRVGMYPSVSEAPTITAPDRFGRPPDHDSPPNKEGGGGGNVVFLNKSNKNLPPPPSLPPYSSATHEPHHSQNPFKTENPKTEEKPLVYPPVFVSEQLSGVNNVLRGLDAVKSQSILDELAGAMEVGQVHRPIRYLEVLTEKARQGSFIPEMGIAVAKKRRDAKRAAERLRQVKEKRPPDTPSVNLEETVANVKETVKDPKLAAMLERMGKNLLKRREEPEKDG